MITRNEYLEFKFDCPKLGDVKNRPSCQAESIGNAIGCACLALGCILLIVLIGGML